MWSSTTFQLGRKLRLLSAMHSTRNGTSLAVSDLKRVPGQSYPRLPRLSDGWIRFQAENTVSQVPR